MIAHTLATYVANDPSVQILAEPGTEGARSWISDNVLPLIYLGIVCVAGGAALSRNFSKLLLLGVGFLFVIGLFTLSGSKGSQSAVGDLFMRFFGLGG